MKKIIYEEALFADWQQKLFALPKQIEIKQQALAQLIQDNEKLMIQQKDLEQNELANSDKKITLLKANIQIISINNTLHENSLAIVDYAEKIKKVTLQDKIASKEIEVLLENMRPINEKLSIYESQETILIQTKNHSLYSHQIQSSKLKLIHLNAELKKLNLSIEKFGNDLNNLRQTLYYHNQNQAFSSQTYLPNYGYHSYPIDSSGYRFDSYHQQEESINQIQRLEQKLQQLVFNKNSTENQIAEQTNLIRKFSHDIANSEKEIATFKKYLQEYSSLIIGNIVKNISVIKNDFELMNNQKNQIQTKKLSFQTQIDFYKGQIKTISEENLLLENSLKANKFLVNSCNIKMDSDNFDSDLDQELKTNQQLQKLNNELIDSIEKNKSAIEDQNLNLEIFEQDLEKITSNHFFMDYSLDPKKLLYNLSNTLLSKLIDGKNAIKESYNYFCPKNQSIGVRIFLAELSDKIAIILSNEIEGEDSENKNILRQKYKQLCGLAHIMIENCEGCAGNSYFINIIESALTENQLEKSVCIEEYSKLKLPTMSVETLAQYERNNFLMHRELFQNEIKTASNQGLNELSEKGNLLLTAIVAASRWNKKLSIKDKDLKYYTILLQRSIQLIKHPTHADSQNEFLSILKPIASNKSATKKLYACGLVFLGAAITAFSIASTFITLGLSSPLSNCGIVLGSSLVLAGLGLFKQATTKQLIDYQLDFYNTSLTQAAIPIQNPMILFPNRSTIRSPINPGEPDDERNRYETFSSNDQFNNIEPSAPLFGT